MFLCFGFQEGGIGGELFDGAVAVAEDAGGAVYEGDVGDARQGVGEAGVAAAGWVARAVGGRAVGRATVNCHLSTRNIAVAYDVIRMMFLT